MSEADLIILVLFVLFAVISHQRGMQRELWSLIFLVLAVVLPWGFTEYLADALPIEQIRSEWVREKISAAFLFSGTLVVGALFNGGMGAFSPKKADTTTQKFISFGFTTLRGIIIATLIVFVASMAPELRLEPWWNDSEALPWLHDRAQFIHDQLPRDSIQPHFDFNPIRY